jgi:aryl-alcohol dehydrogenase-like predicted oxidoreductase
MAKNLNSKLILGTVQFGLEYGINNTNGQVSLNNSHQILQHAFNEGIQILDTAEAYGNAHSVIGSFHEINPDTIFEIITKLPHQFNSKISDKVTAYLSELKVIQLYALLFHSFLSYKENINYFDELIQLKNTGKIKYIGVSVYTNKEIEEVLLNDDVDIIQLPFNLFDNVSQRGNILEKAKAKGKIIHTRSAFLQGLFFKDINSKNKIVQSLKKELLEILKISHKNHISTARLAINYCIQQSLVDNVLIGVDSLRQLDQNIDSLKHRIDAALIDQINKIKVKDVQLLNPSLWN